MYPEAQKRTLAGLSSHAMVTLLVCGYVKDKGLACVNNTSAMLPGLSRYDLTLIKIGDRGAVRFLLLYYIYKYFIYNIITLRIL